MLLPGFVGVTESGLFLTAPEFPPGLALALLLLLLALGTALVGRISVAVFIQGVAMFALALTDLLLAVLFLTPGLFTAPLHVLAGSLTFFLPPGFLRF